MPEGYRGILRAVTVIENLKDCNKEYIKNRSDKPQMVGSECSWGGGDTTVLSRKHLHPLAS